MESTSLLAQLQFEAGAWFRAEYILAGGMRYAYKIFPNAHEPQGSPAMPDCRIYLSIVTEMVRVRQKSCQRLVLTILLFSWLSAALLIAHAVRAADRGPIVRDSLTGLAISGFDPVAYLISGRALIGQARYETKVAGAVWRFVNQGNQKIFQDEYELYAPRFGGHDPVAASRGFIVPGDPNLFLVVDNRVYLFQTDETLSFFRLDPRRIVGRAEHVWPRIVEQSQR